MNRTFLLLFVCVAVLFSLSLAGEFGKHGLRRVRRDELPRAMPPPEHNTTMFKLHNYTLEAQTTIENFGNKKEGGIIVEKLKAQFAWDQIHNDMDSHVIIRFKLLSCLEGDCGPIELGRDHFIELRQGRQALKSLWKNSTDEKPEWNIMHSIIMALTMPTEDNTEGWHRALSPLGECEYRFGRKNDTRHLREIRACDFSFFNNQSALNGLHSMDYESDVELNMNAKFHGKLHLVRGSEKFQLHSPLHPKFGYKIKTEFTMKLDANNDPYHLRFCNGTWTSERCAIEAWKMERMGEDWKELMNGGIGFGEEPKSVKLLASIDPKNDAAVFVGLTRLLKHIPPHDFVQLLDSVAEEHLNSAPRIQHIQAFAAVGEIDLPLMRKHLSKEHLRVYLQALAHRLDKDNRVILQELKKLIDEDKSQLPVSVYAAILNRDCHQSKSKLDNCNDGDNKHILKLLSQLETCNLDTKKCDGHATYAALEQLPIERICKHAAQLVCMSPTDVHGYVLNILSKCDPAYFKAKDIRLLMNTFHNSCYEPVQDSWSLQALDILLNSYFKQPLAGSLLLRSEVEALEKPEKWSYFHQAERALLHRDTRASDKWQQLRNFKVFERNYNNQAIKGNASVDFYAMKVKNIGRFIFTVRDVGSNQTKERSLHVGLQREKQWDTLDLFELKQTSEENRMEMLDVVYPDLEWKQQKFTILLSEQTGRVPLISGEVLHLFSTATLTLDFLPQQKTKDYKLKLQLHLVSQTNSNHHELQSQVDIQTTLSLSKNKLTLSEVEVKEASDADVDGRRRYRKHPGICLQKLN